MNGTNGVNGDAGANGATGATGSNGATGATGATGEKGETGTTGAKGETGAKGSDSVVTCAVNRLNAAGKKLSHSVVRCTLIVPTTSARTAWRLTRSGKTVAKGTAVARRKQATITLGAIRPLLKPGTYTLRLPDRSVTIRLQDPTSLNTSSVGSSLRSGTAGRMPNRRLVAPVR